MSEEPKMYGPLPTVKFDSENADKIIQQMVKDRDIEKQIKHMVDRFLSWKLPEDFNPDGGIEFEADKYKKLDPRNMKCEPVGTNLFTATQAEEMVRYMLAGATESPKPEQAMVVDADDYIKKAMDKSNEYDEVLCRFAVKNGLSQLQMQTCHQNTPTGHKMWLEMHDEKDPTKVAYLSQENWRLRNELAARLSIPQAVIKQVSEEPCKYDMLEALDRYRAENPEWGIDAYDFEQGWNMALEALKPYVDGDKS